MKRITFLLLACFLFSAQESVLSQEKSDGLKDLNWKARVVQTAAVNSRANPVITKVAIRPGVRQAVSVGDDHIANLIHLDSGRISQSMKGHTSWIRSAVFSPDGKEVFTAGADRKIIRWNLEKDSWQIFSQHPKAIESIALSPNGNFLAAVGFENRIRIYDALTGLKIYSGKTPCNDMRAVKFSPSGNRIVAAGRCGTLAIWNYRSQNGRGIWSTAKPMKVDNRRIHTLEFLGENRLASGSESRKIKLIDLGQNSVQTLTSVSGEIFDIKTVNAKWIAVSGSNNHIDIIDWKTKQTVGALKGHTGTVSCLAVGNQKLISGGYDTQVRLWTIPAAGADQFIGSLPANSFPRNSLNSGRLPSNSLQGNTLQNNALPAAAGSNALPNSGLPATGIPRSASLPASENTLLPIRRK